MIVQIFGTKKCKETKKAQRFFSERSIQVQFVDLTIKGPSMGELRAIARFIAPEDLINKESSLYEKKNLKYIQHDILEELTNEPLLMKTPVIRSRSMTVAGFDPVVLKKIIELDIKK